MNKKKREWKRIYKQGLMTAIERAELAKKEAPEKLAKRQLANKKLKKSFTDL